MLVANKKSMAALIRHANSWHQIKNKRAETTPKTQTVAYLQHKMGEKMQVYGGEKNTPKTLNHNSLTDYCLQQMSGWLELKP